MSQQQQQQQCAWVVPNNRFATEARAYGSVKGELRVPGLGCVVKSTSRDEFWIVVDRRVGGKFRWVTRLVLNRVGVLTDRPDVCVDRNDVMELVPAHTGTHFYWSNSRHEMFDVVL